MTNYQKAKVKIANTQLKKIWQKDNARTTSGITKKNFQDEELSHELFLIAKQKPKVINASANNMWTDINLSGSRLPKITQLGGFLGCWLGENIGKLGKKAVRDLAIPFTKNKLPGIVSNIASNAASNALNKFKRRISEKEAVSAGNEFTLFILNEDMDDVIRIIKSPEDSGVLIGGATDRLKQVKK